MNKEKLMEKVFLILTTFSIIALGLICFFIFFNGIPTINEIGFTNFVFGLKWKPSNNIFGILPMILGSIYITLGAILFGGVIGVLSAIYLVFYCKKKFYKPISSAIQLLAAIPSVVYGFFGMVLLVPLIRETFNTTGEGILTASILLGIMILPTVTAISETSLRAVPQEYYDGSRALGSSHEKSIFFAILPAARSGIMASIILGIGRAIGETMAVIMVVGNQAIIPDSILSGARTLTSNIVLEMGYAADLHRQALIATTIILFVFILIINLLFVVIKKRGEVK